MKRLCTRVVLVLLALFLFPYRSPAPLIYTPGEGWTYEMPGSKGDWRRQTAKAQLEVAQKAFDNRQYRLALKAAQRVIKVFPFSDYPAQAEYIMGRCYEAKKMDEKAFNAYQTMLERYPKSINAEEVQNRQFAIALRYLHGQWFKLWGYIPIGPSMEKTSDMFTKIVNYGPYGPLGSDAQMNIGAAREKEKDYPLAVAAYERAADRYSFQPRVAAEAEYKEAMAYNKESKKADYDQSIAGDAISTFTDFMALYPDDPRVGDAKHIISSLKAEEARGDYNIAKYYEKQKKWDGALIYYNEVLVADSESPLADVARKRIDELKKRPTKITPPSAPVHWVPGAAPTEASPVPWSTPPTPSTPATPGQPGNPGK